MFLKLFSDTWCIFKKETIFCRWNLTIRDRFWKEETFLDGTRLGVEFPLGWRCHSLLLNARYIHLNSKSTSQTHVILKNPKNPDLSLRTEEQHFHYFLTSRSTLSLWNIFRWENFLIECCWPFVRSEIFQGHDRNVQFAVCIVSF